MRSQRFGGLGGSGGFLTGAKGEYHRGRRGADIRQLCRWHEDQAIFPHGIVPPQDDLFDLVEKFRGGTFPMPRLFLACGQQDSLYPANLRLRDTLQAMNWPLTWYEAPGDHNWFFWNDALGRAMKELLEN